MSFFPMQGRTFKMHEIYVFFSQIFKKVAVKRTYVSFLWYRKKEENILKNKDILGRFKIFS